MLPLQAGSLVTAGSNEYGQATVPAGLEDAVAVTAGRDHAVAILPDGSAVAWGYWGDNRTAVPLDASDLISADAGVYHTLALRGSGEVTGWGFNGENMLQVPGESLAHGGSPVVDVAAGSYHSLALKGDGTVVGWGYREHQRQYAPPALAGVVEIDAGRDHSLALKYDGTVVAWGYDADGQGSVPAGLSGVVAIAAGGSHNLALKSDGSVIAWGYNQNGQINVPAGLTGVVAIAAGAEFSLALKADGTVVGWGSNSSGQLNVQGWQGISAIAAGGKHSLGIQGEGGPIITGQPVGQTVIAGASASFSVSAPGASGYQWYYNGKAIEGAVESTLSLADVGRASAGAYSVVVSNEAGSTRSQVAALVVRKLHQLAGPVVSGGTVSLAFGDPLGFSLVQEDLARYVVQASSDLEVWSLIEAPLSLVDGLVHLSLPVDPSAPRQFYRVVER